MTDTSMVKVSSVSGCDADNSPRIRCGDDTHSLVYHIIASKIVVLRCRGHKRHQAMLVLAYISVAVTLGLVELVAGVSWEKSATNLHHTLPPFDERSGATPPIFNKRSETIHPLPCKFLALHYC